MEKKQVVAVATKLIAEWNQKLAESGYGGCEWPLPGEADVHFCRVGVTDLDDRYEDVDCAGSHFGALVSEQGNVLARQRVGRYEVGEGMVERGETVAELARRAAREHRLDTLGAMHIHVLHDDPGIAVFVARPKPSWVALLAFDAGPSTGTYELFSAGGIDIAVDLDAMELLSDRSLSIAGIPARGRGRLLSRQPPGMMLVDGGVARRLLDGETIGCVSVETAPMGVPAGADSGSPGSVFFGG